MAVPDLEYVRRRGQVEWKDQVADVDDVVRALVAFANDWANQGGGYVVCGAQETKDEHGFAKLVATGLTAERIKEVTRRVIEGCRERVSPSIAPLVDELPADTSDRRVLVFTMVATSTAHLFRTGDDTGRHYIRVGSSTQEARNGLLLNCLCAKAP
ncbi:MAG: ATP-binding protein [Bryobacterales bacterium]|nr:ATP-binding protein [Bryobacterales bacterium]